MVSVATCLNKNNGVNLAHLFMQLYLTFLSLEFNTLKDRFCILFFCHCHSHVQSYRINIAKALTMTMTMTITGKTRYMPPPWNSRTRDISRWPCIYGCFRIFDWVEYFVCTVRNVRAVEYWAMFPFLHKTFPSYRHLRHQEKNFCKVRQRGFSLST